MEALILLGIVVLPTIIIFLLSHNEDMNTAMNYYKYYVTFNSDNSVRIITEKEYLDKKDFYDTYTRKRLVGRSDFSSIGIGKKHYVGGLLSKNLRNDYNDSLIKQQNTVKINTLTHEEFNLEETKIREGFAELDINVLHSKLESFDLAMKEVFEKKELYTAQTKKYDMFTYLGNYQQYIPIYAEYCALIDELDSRKSNHRIIVEHREYMKEISKLR